MKKSRVYPALFEKEGAGYIVTFPDLPGCLTEGDTLEDAFRNAREALGCYLYDLNDAKAPSDLSSLKAPEGGYALLVDEDIQTPIETMSSSNSDYLAKKLKEKGLSNYKFAQILGVDRAYVGRLVVGNRKPSVELAKRIGALLDCDWRLFYD